MNFHHCVFYALQVIANYFSNNKHLELLTERIIWPGGRTTPPPDTPPCGFEGELCIEGIHFNYLPHTLRDLNLLYEVSSYKLTSYSFQCNAPWVIPTYSLVEVFFFCVNPNATIGAVSRSRESARKRCIR